MIKLAGFVSSFSIFSIFSFANSPQLDSLDFVLYLCRASVQMIQGDSAFKIVAQDMLQQFKAESYDEYRKWTKALYLGCVLPENDFSSVRPQPMIYSENKFKEIIRPTGKQLGSPLFALFFDFRSNLSITLSRNTNPGRSHCEEGRSPARHGYPGH